ncbi:MAG: 50S ribosomal protein L5 [bacterium]|nr:50S ribosomal protein L5 [bacterium]
MSSQVAENPMRRIKIEKVTLNICVGADENRLLKAKKLLEKLTGQTAVILRAKKTIREFHIRRNQPIAVKVTLRGKKAEEFLNRALDAVKRTLKASQFDEHGNFSFGIKEYIDIPGVQYDYEIGMFGMDVCVTLCRPGWRIKYRRRCRSSIGKKHLITREEAIEWVKNALRVEIV